MLLVLLFKQKITIVPVLGRTSPEQCYPRKGNRKYCYANFGACEQILQHHRLLETFLRTSGGLSILWLGKFGTFYVLRIS